MNKIKQQVFASRVYEMGYTGKNVRIAVLDTGAALHKDIADNIIYFKDYINDKTVPYDDNGHGTHISGILCGNGRSCNGEITGMAPRAQLLVFKILDEHGNGRTADSVKALDWILKNHKKYKIRLLNFSMGYLPSANPKLQAKLIEKLEQLWDEGVTIVTAAGNNGPERNSVTVPGISRKVITVGAFGADYSKWKNISSYSGRGPTTCCIVKPEILAPGTDILSISRKGGYERKSGTSMSAPIVCGALALAYEKNPALTPVMLKILLYDTVERPEQKQNQAWGFLHVDKLMEML
uniref:S8 family peptidase n=1 Tax=Agathobacter sp. TaxID=2021311 RepID=UPI004057929E